MAKDLRLLGKGLNDERGAAQTSTEENITEKVGLPTLTDILSELEPGRDPREGVWNLPASRKA